GSSDLAVRIPAALPIFLGAGTISYIGRTQFASAETLGAVTTTGGANTINVTQQTTGVSTAALTLASLTRASGSTINFTNTGGTPINFNAGQTLTLASGGLLVNANLTMGSAVNNGSLTSGGNELFLYVNSGTSTINSAITGTGMALVKSGVGGITLAGTNTYN